MFQTMPENGGNVKETPEERAKRKEERRQRKKLKEAEATANKGK